MCRCYLESGIPICIDSYISLLNMSLEVSSMSRQCFLFDISGNSVLFFHTWNSKKWCFDRGATNLDCGSKSFVLGGDDMMLLS